MYELYSSIFIQKYFKHELMLKNVWIKENMSSVFILVFLKYPLTDHILHHGFILAVDSRLLDEDVLVVPLDIQQFETHKAAVDKVLTHFKHVSATISQLISTIKFCHSMFTGQLPANCPPL